jgi:hypothetical protein
MVANDTPDSGDATGVRSAGHAVRARGIRALRWLLAHGLVAALSVAAGLAIAQLAGEYGYHPARNTATWAAQTARYAIGTTCTACHAERVTAVAAGGHAAVDCQACHGPAAQHAKDGAVVLAAAIVAPTEASACLVCHEAGLGRPVAFAVVAPDVHYGPAPCLVCHDPHTTAAPAPPRVRHSLDRLPACTVCHGPDGLRPVPPQHPTWSGDCLICHLRGGTSS